MSDKITKKRIQENKRLKSIELQMFTYLKARTMKAMEVKAAFDGIASQKTVNGVAMESEYFHFDSKKVEITVVHRANITYDFSYDAGATNVKLTIGDKTGKTGTSKKVSSTKLEGSGFSLTIKVEGKKISNWSLNIKKISVTDLDDKHERVLDDKNPIEKSRSWEADYDTKRS